MIIYLLLFSITFESLLPKAIGLSQGMKFGELLTHFQEHKDKGVNLADFLWMHYAQDSEHKKNHSDHQRLPSLESTFFAFSYITPTLNWFNHNHSGKDIVEQTTYHYQNLYSFQPGFSFLNPPRI
jgi:hypothetical protein